MWVSEDQLLEFTGPKTICREIVGGIAWSVLLKTDIFLCAPDISMIRGLYPET